MDTFVPLTQTLKDWFETPMSALPDDIRSVVEDRFFPFAHQWDRLTAAQRCDLAQQDDNQSDPGKAGERQQSMAIAEQRIDLETKIQELQNAQAPTVSDVVLRDQKVEALRAALAIIIGAQPDINKNLPHVDGGLANLTANPTKENETPDQRKVRLKDRVNNEKSKGTHNFLGVVAAEEGISKPRLKQLVYDKPTDKTCNNKYSQLLVKPSQTSLKKG